MIDYLAAVKTAGTAASFVEGGPLAEALAEINLQAALTALTKAPDAQDRRAQVWSAVTHLEAAQAAIEVKLTGRLAKRQMILRVGNWHLLQQKHTRILALMAICYRYLGEETLAVQLADRVRQGLEPDDVLGLGTYFLGALVSLVNVVDTIRWEMDDARIDWKAFELPPRGLPSPELPQA